MLVAAPLMVAAAAPVWYAAALAMRLIAWALRLATYWPVVLVGSFGLMFHLPTLLGSFLTWVLTEKVVFHKLAFGRIFLWPVRAPSVPLRASLQQPCVAAPRWRRRRLRNNVTTGVGKRERQEVRARGVVRSHPSVVVDEWLRRW
jgi:hypothetical protein